MLPFCGYHMGDYFNHWVKVGETHKGGKLPKIYMVNWFRKDEKGNFIWPGYSENFRALVWIFERLEGKTDNGVSTPWGTIPKPDSFNLNGLNIDKNLVAKTLLHVDNKLIQKEMEELREYFKIFGDQMPKKVLGVLEDIEKKCKQ
jgi:phosphoenolpyruvate carboxykinase (GTP)